MDFCELETSLVDKVSSGTARAVRKRNYVLGEGGEEKRKEIIIQKNPVTKGCMIPFKFTIQNREINTQKVNSDG